MQTQLVNKVITKEEFLQQKSQYYPLIQSGVVFVYPTDTIHGIGCNALDQEAVKKIRELKGRAETPFSVIAPSMSWIEENLEVPAQAQPWLKKLPGPYTLILKKQKQCVAPNVSTTTLGVRIPDYWMKDVAAELGIPIVTTSVNKTGMKFMTSIENMDETIKEAVDFIIDDGEKSTRPSQIIFLDKEQVEVKTR